jgi:hypothetical protein
MAKMLDNLANRVIQTHSNNLIVVALSMAFKENRQQPIKM